MSLIRSCPSRRPQGVIMALVLICMVVSVMLVLAMLQRVMLLQKQTVLRQRQIQSQWIARSAADLAVARLSVESDYDGETWRPDSDEWGDDVSGRADMEWIPESKTLKVIAHYPDPSLRSVRVEREIRIGNEAKP